MVFKNKNGKVIVPLFEEFVQLNEERVKFELDYEFENGGSIMIVTTAYYGQQVFELNENEIESEQDYSGAHSGIDQNAGIGYYYTNVNQEDMPQLKAAVSMYSSTGDPDSPDWEPEDILYIETVEVEADWDHKTDTSRKMAVIKQREESMPQGGFHEKYGDA